LNLLHSNRDIVLRVVNTNARNILVYLEELSLNWWPIRGQRHILNKRIRVHRAGKVIFARIRFLHLWDVETVYFGFKGSLGRLKESLFGVNKTSFLRVIFPWAGKPELIRLYK
jgi:hypothetical protein